jgi:molybdopterin/thiamine biosynthesis adenylyltransferase
MGSSTGHSALVFRAGAFERMRVAMLADAPLETAAFILVRSARVADSQWRLIVKEIVPLQDGDYARRTESSLEVHASALANATKRARAENLTLLLAHTHPVPGSVGPSWIDRQGETAWVPAVRRRVPDVPHGRLIVGQTSAHAAIIHEDGAEQRVRVMEIGDDVTVVADSCETAAAPEPRMHRQALAFGRDGQRRLESLHFAIVGAGGTGSVVGQQLAHLGAREFTLIDLDVVEESNLNRLVGATDNDVGRAKVDVLGDLIATLQPRANVRVFRGDVCDAGIARNLLACDFFFCCTDSEGSRAVLNQFAYQYWLPGIDLGVAIRVRKEQVTHISGRVQMLTPGQPCLLCAEVLDPEQVRRDLLTDEVRARDRYIDGAFVPQPSVISINSTAASLAVTMMLSAVTGVPVGTRNQRIRFEAGIVGRVVVDSRASCPVCSPLGALGRADSFDPPGRR